MSSIAHALFIAQELEFWAAYEWASTDPTPIVEAAKWYGCEVLARYVEMRKSVEQADRLRSELEKCVNVIRAYRERAGIALVRHYEYAPSGARRWLDAASYGTAAGEPTAETAKQAVAAASHAATILGQWAAELATPQDRRKAYELSTRGASDEEKAIFDRSLEDGEAAKPTDDDVTNTGGWTPAKLQDALKVGSTTINKYAAEAGVTRPQRGKRNHRYSDKDAMAIAEKMTQASSKATIEKANLFIANQKQTCKQIA